MTAYEDRYVNDLLVNSDESESDNEENHISPSFQIDQEQDKEEIEKIEEIELEKKEPPLSARVLNDRRLSRFFSTTNFSLANLIPDGTHSPFDSLLTCIVSQASTNPYHILSQKKTLFAEGLVTNAIDTVNKLSAPEVLIFLTHFVNISLSC